MTIESGLVADGAAIPLLGVRAQAEIMQTGCRVRVMQRFANTEDRPLEAVYVFPLPEGSAVCGFTAEVGDRRIVGEVDERERAFERYDDAMMEGDGAYLLDQERPNIFTASVGNLEPGQEVVLAITYVAELTREDDALRFVLPTTISPRYVPQHVQDEPHVGQPDGERINPPVELEVPYGIEIDVLARMGDAIRAVSSPSHPIEVEMREGGAHVTFGTQAETMDRDFVLLIRAEEVARPFASVQREADGTHTAVVAFLPELASGSADDTETVFLVDCSGSMGGTSIQEATRALRLCLRSMNPGTHFNIVRFGSGHEQLFDTPRPYGEATLSQADDYARSMRANMGGTEILRPLRAILGTACASHRQVVLLTDGQVSNDGEVIALAREHRRTTRIFSFGIGAGASEHLVRGVARASRGAAEFIFPGERIEPKVLRQFGRIATPPMSDVRLDLGGLDAEISPREVPPVFDGDALTLYLRIRGGEAAQVVLRAHGPQGPIAAKLPIDVEGAQAGDLAALLWARSRIRELEEQLEGGAPRRGSQQGRERGADRVAEKLVELSRRYSLLSSRTSFVAIEQREVKTDQPAVLRRVPVALTQGWGGIPRTQAAPAPAMPARARTVRSPSAGGGAIADAFGAVKRRLSAGRPHPKMASMAPPPSQEAMARFDEGFAGDACEVSEEAPAGVHLDLLMTQGADGAFGLSGDLAALARCDVDELRGVARALGGDRAEEVVATVLALRLLRALAPDRRDEWIRAARKAARWIGATVGDATVNGVAATDWVRERLEVVAPVIAAS